MDFGVKYIGVLEEKWCEFRGGDMGILEAFFDCVGYVFYGFCYD